MLSDETIKNGILHRNEDHNGDMPPFLVPINRHNNKLEAAAANRRANSVTTNNSNSKKQQPIKILRPETLKRAHNDAIMAASIGDLDWLKQTLKITSEIFYDKNGFATIHLASIHGRLNILRFLIDEKSMDPNFPSTHGWRPIHLCINNQIGARAIECLRYLIEKGVDINVKNADSVTPLHMAATEGHLDCLKILLELHPDTQAKDVRGHTALELARIWGHRMCAKLLNSRIWQEDKKEIAEIEKLERRIRTQDVLKEIEKAHLMFYETRDESEQHFDNWLASQGFHSTEPKPSTKNSNQSTTTTTVTTTLESAGGTNSSLNLNDAASSMRMANQPADVEFPPLVHAKDWNYSTKPDKPEYVTNLDDVYPRDPFTQMPENLDLILINNELKGMSLEQVKHFMKKKLQHNNANHHHHHQVASSSSTQKITRGGRQPFYYRPKHVLDVQAKTKLDEAKRPLDEAGVNLTNDKNTFPFRQLDKFVSNSKITSSKSSTLYGNYQNTDSTVKLIKQQLATTNDDKLNIVNQNYGSELRDFMTDKRHAKMSQKYEKVFIC